MGTKNCVYKFINNNNEISYIGKTKDLKGRISSHNHLPEECYNSTYAIEYCEFETKDDIEFIEKYFIAKYNPKYNEVYKDKDLTIEIEEVKNSNWKIYSNNNFAIRNYLKSIENIEYKLNNIQIDIDIMDYYKMITLEENFTYQFYERYKSYERLKNTEKLNLYKEEYEEMKNKDRFEEIYLLKNKVANEIIRKIDDIFSENRCLEYFTQLPKLKNKRAIYLDKLNQCINLSDNAFKLYVGYKSKYYNSSKKLTVWIKCKD